MKAKKVTGAPMPQTAREEKQATLAYMVRMVARKMSNGLFAVSPGRLGKSKVIAEMLADKGVAPVMLNSHCTPLGLYSAMYHNRRGAVPWLDDADAMYTSLPVLGLLRGALWGTAEGRVVTYTSTQLQGLPGSFPFDSRVICTANVVRARNEAFKAVLSRVDTFKLAATNEEIIERLRSPARTTTPCRQRRARRSWTTSPARAAGGRSPSGSTSPP